MNLDLAVACAAFLMGQPVPATVVHVLVRSPTAIECQNGGRETCGAILGGERARAGLIISPGALWDLQVHEGCHVVQLGNGHVHNGPGAERQCEWIASRAAECR